MLRNLPSAHLSDGPFAVLLDCPRLLDFDVKLAHFRQQMRRMDMRAGVTQGVRSSFLI